MGLAGNSFDMKYDAGFLDASGAFVGLTLNRDKFGTPQYNEMFDPAVANQYFTGGVNYASLMPQKEIQEGQSEFIAGYGLEYQDKSDPKRYYTGANIDARFKGMVIAGPDFNSLVPPTTYYDLTWANSDMQEWDAAPEKPTGWTEGGGIDATKESVIIRSGTYSCQLDGNTGYLHKNATGFTAAAHQGAYVTISAWVKAPATTTVALRLKDDAGTTTGTATDTGITDWQCINVTRKLNAAATYCTIQVYLAGADSVYLDKIYCGVTGTPTVGAFAEFNDDLYIGYGCHLAYIAHADGVMTDTLSIFPYNITSLNVTSNAGIDYLIVGFQGAGGAYAYFNAGVWTVVSLVGQYDFVKQVGDNLKRVVLPNSIYSAPAAAVPNAFVWDLAPGTTVGSAINNITGLEEIEGITYILKEDMPYYLTSAGAVVALIPALISEKASTSGKNSLNWQGNLYIPCGSQALYEYNDGTVADISPSKFITNSTDYVGRVMALASDAQYLYAFVENAAGSYTSVLAGRWEIIDGSTRWVWHPISYFNVSGIAVAHSATVYKRRLWFGTVSNTICYLPLTAMYANITGDTDYKFETGGSIVTPWLHSDLMGDKKAHIKITVNTASCTTAIYWTISYEKLGDSSYTTIGSTNTTAATTTFYVPVDGSANKAQATMFRYKFAVTTNDTSKTPVLLGYDIRGIWYPPQKRLINMQVKVANNLLLRNGQVDETQGLGTIKTALDAWVNPSVAYPREFYPPYWEGTGDTIYCKVMPNEGTPYCFCQVGEQGNLEWIYNLTLLVVTIS